MFDIIAYGEIAGALVAMAGVATVVGRWVTKDVKRDIKECADDLAIITHTMKNQSARIDAIEHLRNDDKVRVAKLEVMVEGLKSGVERVERGQEKLTETINDWMKVLAEKLASKD